MVFELGVGSKVNVPLNIIIGIQQRDLLISQLQNIDNFFRPRVRNAHCFIGTEKYTEVGLNCDYPHDEYSRACGEIFSYFEHLTKDNILPLCKIHEVLRTEVTGGVGNTVGYTLYVFDFRYKRLFSYAQLFKVQ